MKREPIEAGPADHAAWAIPYGDLVTLLLAFFVVMYATSTANDGKYRVLSDALNQAFAGPPRAAAPVQVGEPTPVAVVQPQVGQTPVRARPNPEIAPSTELDAVAAAMAAALRDAVFAEDVFIERTHRGLEITLNSDVLFPSGSADISTPARVMVRRIAGILTPYPHAVVVEGHTDDQPIATPRFPSNWELSAARGVSVVRLLTASGLSPQRLSVQGFGAHRPIADNASAAGRNRNRRVNLLIQPEAGQPLPDLRLAGGRRVAG